MLALMLGLHSFRGPRSRVAVGEGGTTENIVPDPGSTKVIYGIAYSLVPRNNGPTHTKFQCESECQLSQEGMRHFPCSGSRSLNKKLS